ncbi:unnamed protein product [Brassica oleracea var. botrytis]
MAVLVLSLPCMSCASSTKKNVNLARSLITSYFWRRLGTSASERWRNGGWTDRETEQVYPYRVDLSLNAP